MSRIRMSIGLVGFKELKAKLIFDELAGQPWKRALEQAAYIVQSAVSSDVPTGEGKLKAAISTRFQSRPVPMWARVQANRSRGGFRYGWALNFSQRRPYHYRGTSRLTFGWFTSAVERTRDQVETLLERAANEIRSRWGR